MKKEKKSFTLIELLVVIGVIGILAAMILPSLASAREKAKHAACKNNLKGIGATVAAYFSDGTYRVYPPGTGGATDLTDSAWTGNYISYANGTTVTVTSAQMDLDEELTDCPVKARKDKISRYIPADDLDGAPFTGDSDEVIASDANRTTPIPWRLDPSPHNEQPNSYSIYEDGHIGTSPIIIRPTGGPAPTIINELDP